MDVERAELVALLADCGLDGAADWPAAKLAERVNKDSGIVRYLDPGAKPPTPKCAKLWDKIAAHQAAGGVVAVAAAPPGEAEMNEETAADAAVAVAAPPKKAAGKKPAAKIKAGAAAADRAAKKNKPAKKAAAAAKAKSPARKFGSFGDMKAFYAKNPLPLPDDGVLAATVAELKAAGKGAKPKPVTKDQILAALREKFPDRDAMKMETNLDNNVPGRLRWKYGVYVWRAKGAAGDPAGYWIAGDGKKPQPEVAKPAGKKKALAKA